MAKKKREEEQGAPAVNPEVLEAEREYRRDVTVVETVPKVKRAFFFVWMIFDFVLVAIFVVYVAYYLMVAGFTERRHIARIGENTDVQNAVTLRQRATALIVGEPVSFSLGEGRYDFLAELENINDDWYATFRYAFEDDGVATKTQAGFILPNEVRPLVAIGETFEGSAGQAEVLIEDLAWHRVDRHQIPDIEAWLEAHNQIDVEDAQYVRQTIGESIVGVSTFSLTNNSAYAYARPMFFVILERSGAVVGINTVTVPDFVPGETRLIDVTWFASVPTSASVTVVPAINFFDEDVYTALPQGTGAGGR